MGEPTPRRGEQLMERILSRLTSVERRMGKTILPTRLGSVMSSDLADFNDAVETGDYWLGQSRLNSPDPTKDWHVKAFALSTGSVYQRASRIGSPAGNYQEEWTRRKNGGGGAWNPWSLLNRGTTAFVPVVKQGMTVGNATSTGRYEVANGYLRARALVSLGSTSAMLNNDLVIEFPYPMTNDLALTGTDGTGRLTVNGSNYDAAILINSQGVYVRAKRTGNAGAPEFVAQHTITSTTPETWGVGSRIEVTFGYPILP